MCWISYRKVKEKIAPKEGVVVYKVMSKVMSRVSSNILRSPFRNKLMKPNVMNEHVDIKVRSYDSSFYYIEEGYHSFASKELAMSCSIFVPNGKVCEAIIPKGTIYYVNINREIVSENLILINSGY